MNRLHLGCGSHRLSGWINVDSQALPGVDLVLDIPSGLASLSSGEYDHIYSSHVIEHLAPDVLPVALSHLHRMLKTGGVLTLATISLEGIFHNAYLKGYSVHDWNSYLYGNAESTALPCMAHRQCFTSASLSEILHVAGFATVRPWTVEQYPEIYALNDCARSSWHVSLCIEGVR
jgi:predicted SAM-dependent methyltransferase